MDKAVVLSLTAMVHTEQLEVKTLPSEDTWKDIVRIPNKHRKDHNNKHVSRGVVCCLSAAERSKWVVVHGLDTDESVIRMDLNVRLALKLRQDRSYQFTLKKLPWWKALWFPWRASDPIYRLPGQLGLIALILGIFLGLVGIFVSVIPIWEEHHWPAAQHTARIDDEVGNKLATTGVGNGSGLDAQQKQMTSFVDLWKASSIVLTGAFGILGLLKDFKDKKTNKVTRWGYVSLVGILVSTSFGVAAQLKESSDNAAKALALAQKSDMTLRDIERSLSPIDEPEFHVWFNVKCDDSKYSDFCQKIRGRQKTAGHTVVMDDWGDFPGGTQALLPLHLYLFRDPKAAQLFLTQRNRRSDWATDIISTNYAKDKSLTISGDPMNDNVNVGVVNYHPFSTESNGVIRSIIDIPGTTAILTELNGELTRLKLQSFELLIKNGQYIEYDGPFEEVAFDGKMAYRFIFPVQQSKPKPQSNESSGVQGPGPQAPK